MLRLAMLCISIPTRIFFLGVILGVGAFFIREKYIQNYNPMYDQWDDWFLYWMIVGFSLLLSCTLSLLVFNNFSEQVRRYKGTIKATFIIPIFPLLIPLPLMLFSTVHTLYLAVPIGIAFLQYYHYWRFTKNEKTGVYCK